MAFHQFTPADGSEPFGSFETFLGPDTGCYWWSCFPGCLPDGDAVGPFQSEAEAIADANS